MLMKVWMAECLGTFVLVLLGCGAAVIGGPAIGQMGIALAFGLALIAMAYSIGPISGCHINPAVTLGAFVAGRIPGREVLVYISAQVLGGVAAAFLLWMVAQGKLAGFDIAVAGLGQNGWGPGLFGGYSFQAAILFELVATLLFVFVVIASTSDDAPKPLAGLAIGLTLSAIHLVGIPITGVSVNPARSLGPALFVGGKALSQLGLFLVVPSVAGILGGWLASFLSLEDISDKVIRLKPESPLSGG